VYIEFRNPLELALPGCVCVGQPTVRFVLSSLFDRERFRLTSLHRATQRVQSFVALAL
jgi:hypothetical protein